MTQGQTLMGYTGNILRINLTERTTDLVPTSRYAADYLGGRAMGYRIFWDEVSDDVKTAFDPGNKVVILSGPTCGTGIPASARLSLVSISPNNLPEQLCHSNMGGFFSAMLKYAGYDGLIVEGVADRHTYVFIDDDRVEFCDADDFIWGDFVHETQEKLFDRYGRTAQSIVIGPAGENLHRNASITTGNDSAAAKAGFGAVFGSKNLKAIVVRGSKAVKAADPEKILQLHKTVGYPSFSTNPLKVSYKKGAVDIPDGYRTAQQCCGYGCNILCMNTNFDAHDPLNPGCRVTTVTKCVDPPATVWTHDGKKSYMNNVYAKRQENARGPVYDKLGTDPATGALTGSYQYNKPRINDPDDPALQDKRYSGNYPGTRFNYWGTNIKRGEYFSVLCAQYGLDKWDIMRFYGSWFAMAKKEGLLEDMDFGFEVDPEDDNFFTKIIEMSVYRKGKYGPIFSEGMARAIRTLGKEKYGDHLWHHAENLKGEPYEFPISLESQWGHASHYQGRGNQESPKFLWMCYTLNCMADTRDMVCSSHLHDDYDNYIQYRDDPAHSLLFAEVQKKDEIQSYLKDSLVTCEWRSPNPGWPDMEAEMYTAATGKPITMQALYDICFRSILVFRACLMRNHGRCRDMEVEESFAVVRKPDVYGDFCTWDEWNDAVDNYYRAHGYDLATGWPFRSTWEKYGLKDIADEMEKRGMLPPEGGTKPYIRKADPFAGQ